MSDNPTGKAPRSAPRKHGLSNPRITREFSAGVVLFREVQGQRVYLLLDYGRHWDYPKGHLEADETAWQAAVRELREETGIRRMDRVGEFERVMEYEFMSSSKGKVRKRVTYFCARTLAEDVVLSHEHKGYEWMTYDKAMRFLTYESARRILQLAEEYMQGRSLPGEGGGPAGDVEA